MLDLLWPSMWSFSVISIWVVWNETAQLAQFLLLPVYSRAAQNVTKFRPECQTERQTKKKIRERQAKTDSKLNAYIMRWTFHFSVGIFHCCGGEQKIHFAFLRSYWQLHWRSLLSAPCNKHIPCTVQSKPFNYQIKSSAWNPGNHNLRGKKFEHAMRRVFTKFSSNDWRVSDFFLLNLQIQSKWMKCCVCTFYWTH